MPMRVLTDYEATRAATALRNCPHAARISRPRGVRTGAENPAAITISENRAIAAAEDV